MDTMPTESHESARLHRPDARRHRAGGQSHPAPVLAVPDPRPGRPGAESRAVGTRGQRSARPPARGRSRSSICCPVDGIRQIVSEAITNFTAFPPLGIVLVVMMGVAVAEGRKGLISAAVRRAALCSLGPDGSPSLSP